MKVSIVYWSGTGNTEIMAKEAAEAARKAGAEVELLFVSDADDAVLASDAILFGCPAMGSEELEEGDFEPFFSSVEKRLAGKRIGLFGSYDWGTGEWMELWQQRAESVGAIMIAQGIIAHDMPDSKALDECAALGKAAATA
jgi:flavodoxin short chain